jgi:hypothetical protein
MREIRIDSPGAGDWIMQRVGGYFRPGWDHSFSTHRACPRDSACPGDGALLGGFALVSYLGASMTVHMASCEKHWFSRDLAALTFGYAFNQLGVRKLLAPVKSTSRATLLMCWRAGWRYDGVIRDAYSDADMVLLSMTRETCPWLKHKLSLKEAA